MSHKLYVVGLGPGNEGAMTADAAEALEDSEVLVGYSVYINLIPPERLRSGEIYSSGMGTEVERCRYALDQAAEGRTTALVCGGDPGVYGMASLIYGLTASSGDGPEGMKEEKYRQVDIIIIPGVTAALSGAAVLGAPVGNDFAVISLSTALTPWEVIEARLAAAAKADFVIVLYNPASRSRQDTLRRACDIISEHTGRDRIAGYVRNAGRKGEEYAVTTVGEIGDMQLDMFCTVFIGSSATEVINGKMITGRKYRL
ncbi:MAG: precorrin-3B C(17)-methyltransferase [Lachnospiraceae bacterium]|nr:precorrin-3B C(17)-methyltransferase [Lachnospiraceae bacterium]